MDLGEEGCAVVSTSFEKWAKDPRRPRKMSRPARWIKNASIPVVLVGIAMAFLISSRCVITGFTLAEYAFAAGRYDEADKILIEWLKTHPNSSPAYLLKGRVNVAKGRLPEAAEDLRRLQSLAAAREDLQLLRALIAAKAGQSTEAVPTLKQAFAEATQPDRQIDELLAKAYLETFDLRNAAAVLDRWAADFPDDPKSYLWRAEIHGRNGGDAAKVEDDFREALKRDPLLAKARLGLAEELRKAHKNAEAATEYNAYLEQNPDDASAHLGAGRNLMEQGDTAAATEHLERAIALNPQNSEPLVELATASSRRGDWNGVLRATDRAIVIEPYDITSRHLRGLALARLGRDDEAKAEQATTARLRIDQDRLNAARNRLLIQPHDRVSQLEIARWMFDHAHHDEGARWAKQILSDHRDDPDAARLLVEYHRRRGEAGLANFYSLLVPADSSSSSNSR